MGHPAGSLSFYEKSALKLSKTPKNASRYERQVRNGEKRSLLSRFFVGSQVLRMGKMTKNGVLTGILQIRPYIFDQISHWRTVFLLELLSQNIRFLGPGHPKMKFSHWLSKSYDANFGQLGTQVNLLRAFATSATLALILAFLAALAAWRDE